MHQGDEEEGGRGRGQRAGVMHAVPGGGVGEEEERKSSVTVI